MPPRAFFVTLIALSLGLALGCSRSVPSVEPARSPASPRAAAAPAVIVGRALREEPPLPGERRAGWEALDREGAGAEDPHAGHGHHGHGAAPGGAAPGGAEHGGAEHGGTEPGGAEHGGAEQGAETDGEEGHPAHD